MKRTTILLGLLLAVSAPRAQGQAATPGKPPEVYSWYSVAFTKFKVGMGDEARKLIYENFWPVDKEIGREVIAFDGVTGDWDIIVFFPMPSGPSEMAGAENPLNRKWEETLIRRAGGREQYDALMKRFNATVETSKTEIVKRRIR